MSIQSGQSRPLLWWLSSKKRAWRKPSPVCSGPSRSLSTSPGGNLDREQRWRQRSAQSGCGHISLESAVPLTYSPVGSPMSTGFCRLSLGLLDVSGARELGTRAHWAPGIGAPLEPSVNHAISCVPGSARRYKKLHNKTHYSLTARLNCDQIPNRTFGSAWPVVLEKFAPVAKAVFANLL